MQLIAKAFLWVHITLYRLTNGRIGGKFIAGSPILLLTTTGRKPGKRRTRPWPTSAIATLYDKRAVATTPGWSSAPCCSGSPHEPSDMP